MRQKGMRNEVSMPIVEWMRVIAGAALQRSNQLFAPTV
jgi:hypothetical protein